MSDLCPAPVVHRETIARLIREGVTDQGWTVLGGLPQHPDASWAKAADRLCDYLTRRGVEVNR